MGKNVSCGTLTEVKVLERVVLGFLNGGVDSVKQTGLPSGVYVPKISSTEGSG